MSDTAGLYRLQEFGLSDATVSTLAKKEDSFEELVKKIYQQAAFLSRRPVEIKRGKFLTQIKN